MKRQTYRLTPAERLAFAKLGHGWPPNVAEVHRFWGDVGHARGLDPATIIGVPYEPHAFTALPQGHGKHWCWPLPLKCKPVRNFDQEDEFENRSRPAAELRKDSGRAKEIIMSRREA